MTPRTFVFIGMGAISTVHLAALAHFDGVKVLGAVDVKMDKERIPFRDQDYPVAASIVELPKGLRPDFVVIATPTGTHSTICRTALARWGNSTTLLVEKPVAASWQDADSLLSTGSDPGRIRVLYHTTYGAEVLWGTESMPRFAAEHGAITSFESVFNDPYLAAGEERRQVLVSSWIDSGINALSVVARFVQLRRVSRLRKLEGIFDTYEATVDFNSEDFTGQGTVLTSWQAAGGTKLTRIMFADRTELTLDHTASCVRVARAGEFIECWGADGKIDRRELEYMNMYRALFNHKLWPTEQAESKKLHSLLLDQAATVK